VLIIAQVFYTGNARIARIISAAAAKHLTPLTLELGGKSPVIVDGTSDVALAARRILFGKATNAGQICISPDYVLVQQDKQDELIEGFKAAYKSFFPDGAIASDSYARIVSDNHFSRLKSLLARTKGEIVMGGGTDDKRGFEPTVLKGVKADDALMDE
jgi:aldehyde dehydrogenase (NAD+)